MYSPAGVSPTASSPRGNERAHAFALGERVPADDVGQDVLDPHARD